MTGGPSFTTAHLAKLVENVLAPTVAGLQARGTCLSVAESGREEIRSDAMAVVERIKIIVTRRYLGVTRNSTMSRRRSWLVVHLAGGGAALY